MGARLFDYFFKTFIVILAALFIFMYYQNSKNGRYILYKDWVIMDTSTGVLYIPSAVAQIPGFAKVLQWEQKSLKENTINWAP